MELTDPNIIKALLAVAERRQKSRRSRQITIAPGSIEKRRTCKCGTCVTCLDNARWEAIFNAKFADPDYYKSRPVRGGSSLAWVRPAARPNSGRDAER